MVWLEVVSLRFTGNQEKKATLELLKELGADVGASAPVKFVLYHRAEVGSDVSIHLYWDSQRSTPGKTSLGRKLVHLLSEFGLINHSVWIEENVLQDP